MIRSRGYTLVEVLVVIGILATVVLMAAPLSGRWMSDASMQESEGQLKEAIGRAKSLALRNEMAARGNTPVAAVCLTNGQVSVLKGLAATPVSCAAPTGEKMWQGKISEKVTIKNGGVAFTCACFDNKALVTKAGACNACASNTEFVLSAGSSDPHSLAIY